MHTALMAIAYAAVPAVILILIVVLHRGTLHDDARTFLDAPAREAGCRNSNSPH